jgi:hypothetical protein
VTAYPAWTPASRPGIVPLHPLTFGTILGRSFVALRQNPRVLLGFALVVQTVAYLLVLLAIGAVAWASFSRLLTVQPGTDEFDTIMAGSIAVTAIAGVVLGLAAGALGVIVQGVVVVEVTRAVVAEKLTLREIWGEVKPIAWRLIGYAVLLTLAAVAGAVIIVAVLLALGVVAAPAAIGLGVLAVLAWIPLYWWLMIKLLLVPAAIIVERATIGQALRRSWTLIRGRFWAAFGVIIVISLIFGAVSQVVSLPFSFLSAGVSTVIAPTGDPTSSVVTLLLMTLLTYAVLLVIQSIAVVIQATATSLIYVDCRMRREGLDLDLMAYVEQRDAGVPGLPDPYRAHIGRTLTRTPAVAFAGVPPQGYPVAQGRPAYPTAQGYPHAQGHPAQPAPVAPPAYAASPAAGAMPPVPPAAPPAPAASDPGEATRWTAPGAPADGTDRESPWP